MTDEQLLGELEQLISRHKETEYRVYVVGSIISYLSNHFSAKKTSAGAKIANIIDEQLNSDII